MRKYTLIKYIAGQIDVPARTFDDYKWKGRSVKAHRAQIRKLVGFRKWSRGF